MGRDSVKSSQLNFNRRWNPVTIWVDNQIVEPTTDFLSDDGWPLGQGIFETLRTEDGHVQLLMRHMRRAVSSGRSLAIPIPGEGRVEDAISQLLNARSFAVGRLRLTFSQEHFIATHDEYTESDEGLLIKTRESDGFAKGRQHKSFPYTKNLDALKLAKSEGFGEILYFDQDMRISEGAVSNYAFRIDGQWVTTPISAGILPGVIRALAIERCDVLVRDLSLRDVAKADAAIAMSSLKIAKSVAAIDGRTLNQDDGVSQICRKLRQIAASR